MLSGSIQSGAGSHINSSGSESVFISDASTTSAEAQGASLAIFVSDEMASGQKPTELAFSNQMLAMPAVSDMNLDELNLEQQSGFGQQTIEQADQTTGTTPDNIGQSMSQHFQAAQQLQQQPNAEVWLQTMLDQQQLQLQARDSMVAASDGVVELTNAVSAQVNTLAESLSSSGLKTVQQSENKSGQMLSITSLGKAVDENGVAMVANGDVLRQKKSSVDKQTILPTIASDSAVAKTIFNSHAAAIAAKAADSELPAADAKNSAAHTNANLSTTNTLQFSLATTNETGISDLTGSISSVVASSSAVESAQRSTQSHLNLHAPEAKWGEQLLHALRDHVQVQIQQKIQQATIRLDPPELGSLEIYLSHESGRLQVQITASQADVARLIQQTSDRLRHELSGAQFTQVNIQTSADGQSGQQQSRERQRFVSDELSIANAQEFFGNDTQSKRTGDVLVTV